MWIATLTVITIALLSAYLRATLTLHPEGDIYLVDHLSDRPYIAKILSPHINDAEHFQARPVSHFFENSDAHFFYLSYLLGKPIFISVCTTALLIILSAVLWIFATGTAGINPATATFMLVFLWMSPNVFFAGTLYREAKIAATFFLTVATLFSFRFISHEQPPRFFDFAIIFMGAILACLSDLQGVAFVLMLSGIALVWTFFTASKNAFVSFLAGFCAFLTYIVLSLFLLPGLIAKYSGFNTHNIFHRFFGSLSTAGTNGNVINNLGAGLIMYLDMIRSLFCNVSRIAIAALVILLLVSVFKLKRPLTVFFCLILFMMGNCVMESALIPLYPYVALPELICCGYYQLPSTVLFFTVILLIMKPLRESFRIPQMLITALFAIAVCVNIIALPHHAKTVT